MNGKVKEDNLEIQARVIAGRFVLKLQQSARRMVIGWNNL